MLWGLTVRSPGAFILQVVLSLVANGRGVGGRREREEEEEKMRGGLRKVIDKQRFILIVFLSSATFFIMGKKFKT